MAIKKAVKPAKKTKAAKTTKTARTSKTVKPAKMTKTVKAAAGTRTAKTAKSAGAAKTAMKKGSQYACGVCGLAVTVNKACGCVEAAHLICCGKPMKAKKK